MIEAKQIHYTFQDGTCALNNISFSIEAGSFVVLTGVTGCGKTTLLKCINGIIPHDASGYMTGQLFVAGKSTATTESKLLAKEIGYLFQSPDEQIFFTGVYEEMAFGLENYGYPVEEIEARIEWALALVGMSKFKHADTNKLSGGQKQRVVLASLLALKPKILLLDEPVSQLDPQGTVEVLNAIRSLKEHGMTIVMIEHRLHEVMPFADRLIVMDKGEIQADVKATEVEQIKPLLKSLGLRNVSPAPPTIEQLQLKQTMMKRLGEVPLVHFQNVAFTFEKKKRFAKTPSTMLLQDINFDIYEGEIVAIVGENGSGKSTMLHLMAGLYRPTKGTVKIADYNTKKTNSYRLAGTVGIVFQYPALMLTCDTVERELSFGPHNKRMKGESLQARINETSAAFGLKPLLSQHPQTLSGGQRLRCATASVVTLAPRVLLLDEPTSGQDLHHIESLLHWCHSYAAAKNSVIFITHDIEMAVKYATRIIVVANGKIIKDGYV